MMGNSITGFSSLVTGNFAQSRRHHDHALPLYDAAVHRPLAMLFGQDVRVADLSHKVDAVVVPRLSGDCARRVNQALKEAREIGQAGSLLHALNSATIALFLCGTHTTAETLAKELFALADKKAAFAVWKPAGLLYQGWLFALPVERPRRFS